MSNIFDTNSDMTAEQRLQMYFEMTGQRFDGTVNYSSVDDNALMQSARRERAREEMVAYLIQCLQEEYGIEDSSEALLKWEDFKERHNITIKEQVADE